jgi:hypothetical protein
MAFEKFLNYETKKNSETPNVRSMDEDTEEQVRR